MKVPIIVKRKYLEVELILITDDNGILDEVKLPESTINIIDIIDCNCRRYCVKETEKVYMDRNVEAYR